MELQAALTEWAASDDTRTLPVETLGAITVPPAAHRVPGVDEGGRSRPGTPSKTMSDVAPAICHTEEEQFVPLLALLSV